MKIIKYISYIVVLAVIAVIVSSCVSYWEKEKEKEKEKEIQKTINDYQKACKELDFETARECLNKIRQNYNSSLTANNLESFGKIGDTKAKYYAAFDYIYKAEIQYILSEFDDKTCVDKITFLLSGIPIEGQKPRAGLCDEINVYRGAYDDRSISLDAYIIWTEHYNHLCNTILTLSINRNYPQLAKAILLHFVDNVETYKGDGYVGNVNYPSRQIDGVKVDSFHGYIKFTSTDRDAAKKKYNEAVKMGYLKK